MLKYENVLEMFDLLMDEECAEIRGEWDKVFAAHVIGTAGVADIVDWTNFEEEWKRRDDEECAWKWLWEGEYRDLLVVYVPEETEREGEERLLSCWKEWRVVRWRRMVRRRIAME
jgi:hypothetical protein